MKSQDIIAGLTILEKYVKASGDAFSVCAEHDIIYAGPSDASEVRSADAQALEELGWHISSDCDRWAAFV